MSAPKQRTPRRPRSVVWYYFEKLPDDPFKAKCRLCNMICQHGSNTSNMFCHLRSRHPASYEEAENQREQDAQLYMELKAKAGKTVTPYVRTRGRGRGRPLGSGAAAAMEYSVTAGTLVQIKPDPDGPVSSGFTPQALLTPGRKSYVSSYGRGRTSTADINRSVLHWLAVDMLHPSIVLKKGFKNFLASCSIQLDLPDKKSITNKLIPKLVAESKAKVQKELETVSAVAITLETWRYRESQEFLTVTAHCIEEGWIMTSYVLETLDYTEDKTETNVATSLKRVADEWGLTGNVLVLLSNLPDEVLSNAIIVNGWEELACFGHTLNLVVKNAIASVTELVRIHTKMREASVYFYENLQASEALTSVQQQHSLPVERLKQERTGLWTSTYTMMQKMVSQYEAVNTVLCLLGKDNMCLCDDEVELVREVIQILNPFQAAVEELCTEQYTCVSKLIPLASLLQQVTSSSLIPDEEGAQADLKSALISEMHQRFSNLENSPLLAAATLLDPRFKHHAFTDMDALAAAQERLLLDTQAVVKTSEFVDTTDSSTSINSSASLWGMFDKKVVNAKALKTDVSEADNETQRFFKEVNIMRTADPFQWWRVNEGQFPHLKILAKKFLCVPATATPSNRLFSKQGIEFSQQRDKFRPAHLNNMLFLNQNLI